MPMDDERLADEVSRLYWETDLSVGEIAAQLDISRRALYAALRPLPAGAACAECGTDLVFMTRSARTERAAECPACGNEQEVAEPGADEHDAVRMREEAGAAAAEHGELVEDQGYAAAVAEALRSPRGVMIAAAALAGVVAGVVTAVRVLRR